MNVLKFGWAEIDITPDKKASLAGQFAERISEYVEKPITATALAIESGDQQAVFCACDLVSVSFRLVEAVRARIAALPDGPDPDGLIISAIHTHTAPVYPRDNRTSTILNSSSSFQALLESQLPPDKKYIPAVESADREDVITPQEYFDLLIERLTAVITDAWRNRAAGSFSNAFGRAVVGLCRRVRFNDGSAQMWGDTNTAMFTELEGGNDSGIELLYVNDENGKLKGIVANLACPAQCVQHRLFISPDFWGEVKVLLREYFGEEFFLLPLCSAAGDQCPVDLVRWVEPESDLNDPNLSRPNPLKRKADPSMFDLAGMRKAGKRIAREIIDVYEEGLDAPQKAPIFSHEIHWMQLPLRRVTLSDIKAAEAAIRDYLDRKEGNVNYIDAANLQVHLGILRRAQLQEMMETLDTEVHIIRLGTVAFATNPFELFLDYGNQIRARSKAEQTFLIQLANGSEGYLPTERAELGGHYSAFVSSGTCGHIGGEQLVRETLKNINKLF